VLSGEKVAWQRVFVFWSVLSQGWDTEQGHKQKTGSGFFHTILLETGIGSGVSWRDWTIADRLPNPACASIPEPAALQGFASNIRGEFLFGSLMPQTIWVCRKFGAFFNS
jgi:hypothetical protein